MYRAPNINPTFSAQDYRAVVSQSHELAINIAQYAESFDKIVVKFCADESLTVERRKEKINQFIDKGEAIKNDAKDMGDKFTGLIDTFTAFVSSFKTWAVQREEADGEKIKEIFKDIEEIDKKIHDIDVAMIAIGAALAATLPATGILAALFPPAAPWIMGIGCAIAGVEIASLTGLAIAKNILLNEKRQKESHITDLQDEITKIKATRTQLEERGQTDLMTFSTNIKAIAQVWTNVQNDALLIKEWLEDGAKDADAPEYMQDSLEKGVKVYARMGQYLEDYANGVKGTVKRFDA
ncbi:hypothetical protein C8Q74DRAFT_806184 [Fomes fomentarius]|nr:hypothetical protein C8Q74DRAFT_806184 [Fomes fomentarius]